MIPVSKADISYTGSQCILAGVPLGQNQAPLFSVFTIGKEARPYLTNKTACLKNHL